MPIALQAPPPAAPEAHREMQERLAARRANRRQQLLDVVGREVSNRRAFFFRDRIASNASQIR